MRETFSYMNELEHFDWDGERSLIVFDGVCVLCSFFAQWVVAHDKDEQFLFTTAQSPLGQTLYDHYNLDNKKFETNLVIIKGQLFEKMPAVLAVFSAVGFPWRLFAVFNLFPLAILNWVYERIARNRYRLFGKQECSLIEHEVLRQRLVGFEG